MASLAFSAPTRKPLKGSKPPRPKYGDEKKTDAGALRAWQLRQIAPEHPYRLRFASTWRRSDLFKMGYQWLQRSYNLDSTTMHWSRITFELDDDDAIPTPVFNETAPIIDNEASRLSKPEYEPYARCDENADLKLRTAAILAQDVLQSELERMNFGEESARGHLHMPQYGQWLLFSRWAQTYENTTKYPVESAMRCPNCDFKVASPALTDKQLPMVPEGIRRDDTNYTAPGAIEAKHTLTHCATCDTHPGMQQTPLSDEMGVPIPDPATGVQAMIDVEADLPGPPELEPFTPIGEELDAMDHFGEPLGEDIPDGEWQVTTLFPDQVFPENMGVDVTNRTIRGYTIVEVHELEWFANNFANGHKVQAEDPQEIMRFHPVAGERQIFFGNRTVVMADGLFRNHCRLRSSYLKPWREAVLDKAGQPVLDRDGNPRMGMNHGRAILMAGDLVLFDGDYEIESQNNPGAWIERVHLENMVHEERSGGREYFGVSLYERLFDVQENINEVISQVQDARQAMASPKWLIPRGLNFDYESSASAGAYWLWDADPGLPPEFAPREVPGMTIDANVYTELEKGLEYAQRTGNMGPIDQGGVPPGVAAALAIQMLAEQTNEQRRPRIKRIREGLERIFSHGLELLHELVREPREIWKSAEVGEWQKQSWTGTDLCGMTDIKIKAEPEHDTTIQRQQLVRDMIEAGLFDLQDPRTRRIVAREMGGDSELFKQQDVQEDSAEREYITYRDDGLAPVVEDDLDNHKMHVDRHMYDIQQEWSRDKEKTADWRNILPFLGGWNEPGPPVPQQQVVPDPAAAAPGAPPPAAGAPPGGAGLTITVMVPTPSPLEMYVQSQGPMAPKLLEYKILGTWQMMLDQAVQMGLYMPNPDPAAQEALHWVMRFRAHIMSHRIRAEMKATAAAAGASILAPSGSPATSGGMMVTPGAAPGAGSIGVPQPGVGAGATTVPGSTMPVSDVPASVGAMGAPA